MKTNEEIAQYILSNPTRTDREIAQNLRRHGVKREIVARVRESMKAAPCVSQRIGRPIDALIEQFDDVAKVQKTMKAMPRKSYMEDDEMRRANHIGLERWRSVRQHSALTKFIFKLPNGRHVWMHEEAQKDLAGAIDLSQQ